MPRNIFSSLLLILIFSKLVFAQLSHQFKYVTRNSHYGTARNLTVGPDGSVFLANDTGGLRAYNFNGKSFTTTAHIDNGGNAYEVVVYPNGTIFMANSWDGIRAYTFDGTSFRNTAHFQTENWPATDISIDTIGNIFVATNVLEVFTYDGNSFTRSASGKDYINYVTVGEDGTVFCLFYDYLKAYTYNGTDLTNTASIYFPVSVSPEALEVGPDGTIFFATSESGIQAVTYNGESFTQKDKFYAFGARAIAINSDGIIFLGSSTKLWALRYDGTSFKNLAEIEKEGSTSGLAVFSDEVILLSNFDVGINAYRFTNSTFQKIAHVNDSGIASGIAVTSDNSVFLANDEGGLRVYKYDAGSLDNIAHIENNNLIYRGVAMGSNETIFVVGNSFDAYSYNGISLTNTAHIDISAPDLAVGPDGTIFLPGYDNVLRAYTYDGFSLTNTAYISTDFYGGSSNGVDVGPDGTVFLANGFDALRAYTYNGTSFTPTAYFVYGNKSFRDVAVGSDGTIFLANGEWGLFALSYDGSSFTKITQIHNGGRAYGLAIDRNGTIFVANYTDGLRAYTFNGTSFTNTAHANDISNAYDVEVAPDGTIFVANTEEGMYVYNYTPVTGFENNHLTVPTDNKLYQNYPNPFNPKTNIEFTIATAGQTELAIYNLTGEKVGILLNEYKKPGTYTIEFDASDYASGVYFYLLKSGSISEARKMLLIK